MIADTRRAECLLYYIDRLNLTLLGNGVRRSRITDSTVMLSVSESLRFTLEFFPLST